MRKDDYQFEIDFSRCILKWDPDNLAVMEMLAGFLTKSGRIDEGLAMDKRIVEMDPENAISHYNLACSLALKRNVTDAIHSLRGALERGYDDFDWLLQDPDLAGLHNHPAFSALIAEFKAQS
ncbi:MAG: TPR end-of-group domain-containing protein [Oceanipulchritudo sp.]